MTSYICSSCGYRLDSERPVKRCPYCDDISIEKEKTAEELLASIEKE